MTNEEAIETLKNYPCACKYGTSPVKCTDTECDFGKAIKTLIERPKGKWVEVDVSNCHATLKCSVCDRVIEPTFTFGEYSYEDIKTFYPFCHCGAEMRGDV